jgi:drug/metabolite transporter (DMT)-like permease
MVQERKPIDANAFVIVLVLGMVWGCQNVVIKLTTPEVSLLMQGALRFTAATMLVFLWARVQGISLFRRDATLGSGVAVGVLFALEYIFLYTALGLTLASRLSTFVYLAPVFSALGLHLLVPGERLAIRQWIGLFIALAGVAVAMSEGFTAATGASTLLGDFLAVVAGIFRAAGVVTIRASALSRVPATKTLFYQVAIAALVLPAASWTLGEPGIISFSAFAAASLAYQTVIAGFGGLLVWLWLLRHYLAARLSVLSLVTPLFGVLAGVVFLDEPLTGRFLVATLLVGAGIVLVNLRR